MIVPELIFCAVVLAGVVFIKNQCRKCLLRCVDELQHREGVQGE